MYSFFGQDPLLHGYMGGRSPYQVRQYPGYRVRTQNNPQRSSYYDTESRYNIPRRYMNSNYNQEIPITRKRNMYDLDYQYKIEKRKKLLELKKKDRCRKNNSSILEKILEENELQEC